MKALCWQGVNRLAVEQVPDPRIQNKQEIIVKVRLTTTCGSDLHLIGGYVPAMRAGDVIGHEFVGEVVEVGSEVSRHRAAASRAATSSTSEYIRVPFGDYGAFTVPDGVDDQTALFASDSAPT